MPDRPLIDSERYRQVLSHYPTGVSVVTAATSTGEPLGMVVGTFTSLSLEPPMVAFMPSKSSTSWPLIRDSGAFCANVLSEEQKDLCQTFATSGGDKFAGVSWKPSASGSPILEGVVAWVDCHIEQVFESGDHYIVVGRVLDLDIAKESSPLAFFQGAYRSIAPQTTDLAGELAAPPMSIAEQAASLFAERGSRSTMAREVAELMSVPEEEIHNWFASRDRIVERLLTDYLETLLEEYARAMEHFREPRDLLHSLIAVNLGSIDDHRAAVIMFQNERANLADTRFPDFASLERRMEILWVGVLSQGVDSGDFRRDLDIKLAYRYICDATFMVARWYKADGRLNPSELAAQYGMLLLEGVATTAKQVGPTASGD